MIRGLSLYEVEYLVAIVSLFVSIGALGVLIAIVAK
ncbi:hypothetical protein PHMEG_00022514 [Phytophthora megakarya]|uniref:Uncharacterized protein n=1 Tax=Phytophthora megakarya TaxID=4795 RepID=A0A225VJ04_9STRA|nr:hypothetical protein PHMEG_00022514 [Phytophthora megakarya]